MPMESSPEDAQRRRRSILFTLVGVLTLLHLYLLVAGPILESLAIRAYEITDPVEQRLFVRYFGQYSYALPTGILGLGL